MIEIKTYQQIYPLASFLIAGYALLREKDVLHRPLMRVLKRVGVS